MTAPAAASLAFGSLRGGGAAYRRERDAVGYCTPPDGNGTVSVLSYARVISPGMWDGTRRLRQPAWHARADARVTPCKRALGGAQERPTGGRKP